jgi:hypothetical protein
MRGQGKKKVLINIASALPGWFAEAVNTLSVNQILGFCILA